MPACTRCASGRAILLAEARVKRPSQTARTVSSALFALFWFALFATLRPPPEKPPAGV